MTARHDGPPEVHLFEPTGYGGIFQHTCWLALGLNHHGRRVVLHTGHEHENVRLNGVEICECSWWPRLPGGGPLKADARRAMIARRLVGRTLPHLVRSAPPGAVLHLQGTAATGGFNLLTLSVWRRAHHRVVYSPHDVFSRNGRVDGTLLWMAYWLPHAIVVHSRADMQRLRGLGHRVHYSPLIQLVPRPSAQEQLSWSREWRAEKCETVVLFAGFVRPDKRLDVLIESARNWPPGRRLAIVGPDKGDWPRCDALARKYKLDIAARLEFVDLHEFTAAIAAADLVVVPSERASQSGVLALARQLGTPTVAADVGGMPELASRTFRPGDVDDLTLAIEAELASALVPVEPLPEDDQAVHAHLRAYGEPT